MPAAMAEAGTGEVLCTSILNIQREITKSNEVLMADYNNTAKGLLVVIFVLSKKL